MGAVAPLIITDAAAHARYSTHPCFVELGVRSYVAAPIILADGRVFGTLCAFDRCPAEIPDRTLQSARRFAELLAAHLDARQVHEEREQFIAVAAHDLRTPLMVADHAAGELRRQYGADPNLDRLERSIGHMAKIVAEITDLARGRFGQNLPIAPVRLDASGLVSNAIDAHFGGGSAGAISTEIEPGLTASWDLTRMQQLVGNLVSNAQTHASPGSRIHVALKSERDRIVLSVANVGEPIPPRVAERLFEPFRRGPGGGKGNGLGLGLHIVKQVAEAHGGIVGVSSDACATTFRVELPRLVGRTGATPGFE